MHLTSSGGSAENVLLDLVFAPLNHPELLPGLLPLIGGALVVELYFGKHREEELGWNTSVGNAVIWVTTGLNILMTTTLNYQERLATYTLIGLGGLVAYMDFFHKWSSSIAFRISSSAIVYTLAYVLVIMVKTSIPVTAASLKAAAIFVIGANIGFRMLQGIETPVTNDTGLDNI